MFVPFLFRKDITFLTRIALSLITPVLVTAQVDSRPMQRPALHSPEKLFNTSSLHGELEGLKAQLAAHPERDEVRASLLTEMASLQSRLGFLIEAKQSSQSVLSMGVQLPPEYLGVSHFVLANALNLLGGDPEPEYLEAARQFSIAGPRARTRLALTYSELAMLYLRRQNVRASEEYLQKSLRSNSERPTPPALHVIQVDTGAHIALNQGRLTDAFTQLRNVVRTSGTDPLISLDLRSHMSRDLAELCVQDGRLDEAKGHLQNSIQLQEQNGDLGQAAVSLAMLGSVHSLSKAPAAASDAFRRAEMLLDAAPVEKPFEVSIVHAYHGIFLVSQRNWQPGRECLLKAIQAGASDSEFLQIRRKCLASLLTADERLRNKEEAKEIRAALKHGVPLQEKPQDTVDLMTLKRAVRSGN